MSRAYQIKLSESKNKLIRAEDHVSTELELLNILPAEEMSSLLAAELVKEGFAISKGSAQKSDGDISITVDLKTLKVTVKAESEVDVKLEAERSGTYYNDEGSAYGKEQAQQRLEKELAKDLTEKEKEKADELQNATTEALEGKLCDIRAELDRAINRTTAEALKQKAAQIGEIKEIQEDAESGSLTIVVDV